MVLFSHPTLAILLEDTACLCIGTSSPFLYSALAGACTTSIKEAAGISKKNSEDKCCGFLWDWVKHEGQGAAESGAGEREMN